MGSTNRRQFLKLSAKSLPAAFLANGNGALVGQKPNDRIDRSPSTVDRYIDSLPIPKKLECIERHKDADVFRVRMMEFEQQLHSQLPPTKLWGYEAQYPGPTIEARQGRAIEVHWENWLPQQHLFAVDQHIHGAMAPAPAVRAVPHLHGARTSSMSDGLPEKWFVPGSRVIYRYPNHQPAATLWYHDHALGITRLNVYAGLSGFYLLRDDQELSMGLPGGAYEIPLCLQDRTLDNKAQLVYSPTLDDGVKVAAGAWGPQFFGDLPLVNGAIYPYFDVEPRPYRLRVLNAANGRFFDLYLNLADRPTDIPSLVSFLQIGSDGGLLQKPAKLERILLAPAERGDLIVDFSGLEGKTVTLSNNAPAPYPGWSLLRPLHEPLSELMQFRVRLPLARPSEPFFMKTAIDVTRMDPREAVVTRDFVLSDQMDSQGKSRGMRINEKGYDDQVTESPKLGTMERWRFINMTDDAHPMHLHLVQFQILERQGFNFGAMLQGRLEFVGSPRQPAASEAGWKDTAVVNPHDVLTILVRFEGFTGRYVYHCHVAEHEDNDMMRPFDVVT